jgi:hypothetical protein
MASGSAGGQTSGRSRTVRPEPVEGRPSTSVGPSGWLGGPFDIAPAKPEDGEPVRSVTFTLLAAFGTLAACTSGGHGGSDAGPDSGAAAPLPSPALDPIDACNQIATARTSLEVRCDRLAAVDQANWAAAYCAGWIETQQAEFDAGLLAYDPAAVACEAAFRKGQACNLATNSPSGCGVLAWGVLLTGDPCGDPSSCQEGDYCDRSAAGIACGSCTADPQIGAACGPAVSNAPCQGSQCDGFNCEAISALGGGCGAEASVCGPGLTCNTSDVCANPAVEGAPCGQDGDCLDGLYCDPNLFACTLRPAVGAPCPAGYCAFGAVCVGPPEGVDGGVDGGAAADAGPARCLQMTPLGPCVAGFCLEGEACGPDGGCVAQPGLGQPCTAAVPCLAGSCFAGVCTSLPANQPCSSSQECQSDLCGGTGAFPVCAGSCAGL